MIYQEEKILITGKNSSIGKDLQKILPNCIYVESKDYDLTNEKDVIKMFETYKPYQVCHLANVVGSLFYNIENPTYILEQNILMNTLILKYAKKYNVKHFFTMLSTCAYAESYLPASYPLYESLIFTGELAKTNKGYGMSKRLIAEHIKLINENYNLDYSYLIPCNLYSVHDKFELNKSHFLNSLILKIWNEKYIEKKGYISLKGTGKSLRQFIDSSDLARVISEYIIKDYRECLNVADKEYSILEMCEISLKTLGLENEIEIKFDMDVTKDGTFKKTASTNKFKEYFPNFEFKSLENGIKDLWCELNKRNKI